MQMGRRALGKESMEGEKPHHMCPHRRCINKEFFCMTPCASAAQQDNRSRWLSNMSPSYFPNWLAEIQPYVEAEHKIGKPVPKHDTVLLLILILFV